MMPEMEEILELLRGSKKISDLPNQMSADYFAENVLLFEEVDENELEEAEEEGMYEGD